MSQDDIENLVNMMKGRAKFKEVGKRPNRRFQLFLDDLKSTPLGVDLIVNFEPGGPSPQTVTFGGIVNDGREGAWMFKTRMPNTPYLYNYGCTQDDRGKWHHKCWVTYADSYLRESYESFRKGN